LLVKVAGPAVAVEGKVLVHFLHGGTNCTPHLGDDDLEVCGVLVWRGGWREESVVERWAERGECCGGMMVS
jgi:hypothetical protein